MRNVKMVISDMDGTLLNSNNEVSPKFFDIFKQLKAQNIVFVAASGRPYYSIVNKLKSIEADIIVVAENGGIVLKNKDLLLSNSLNEQNVFRLSKTIDSIEHTYPLFCTRHKAYIKRASEELIQIFSEYYTNYTIIDSVDEIKDDVIKIALYNTESSEKHIYPHVKHLKSEFNVVVSGNHWVDISDLTTNKGHAINFLQQQFNIKPSETMAFGDYNNDYEMLQQAEYSYAMSNAHNRIKNIAKYQTKSNDEYGVEMVLEELIGQMQ
ncbi:HAD family hydrolase [Psychroserpens sp. XS_ASV72]|uniref:HAD family hydrolase n=1 Tax=Psychroserpens sp. XS_ASV72 TaxID=3241293 RepID=UPI003511DC24